MSNKGTSDGAEGHGPADTIRILHLEDDPVTSQLVRESLRREGLEVELDRVDTLPAFAQCLASGSPALILSDFSLPGMDAFEALWLARKARPDLPYVFFSGTLGEEAAVQALKEGATDYVLKDRPARLPSAVRRALREANGVALPRSSRPAAIQIPSLTAPEPEPPDNGQHGWKPTPVFCYAVSVLTVLAAWGLRAALDPYLNGLEPFAMFLIPVLLMCWWAGPGPAILAACLGWLIGDYFFCPPRHTLLVTTPLEITSSLVYVVVTGVLIGINTHLRRGREQLRASQERFNLFMDHAPSLVWVKDEQGRYVFFNRAYERRFGVRLSDWQGKTDEHLWGPETAARLRQADQTALAAGQPIELTEETTEADGSTSYWHNTKFPFQDYAGRRFVASLGLDITPRIRAEHALRASEERLQKAFATPTVGVLFFQLEGGMHEANATFLRLSGYTVEELRSFHWKTLTPPEFWEVTARAADELAERGETAPYEKQMVRKDGSRWWGLFAPVRLSGSGRQAECLEFVIDITARKQTEEALRRSELVARQRAEELTAALQTRDQALAQLNALLENAPLGFAFYDRKHRFARINRYLAHDINGLTVEAHLGHTVAEVHPVYAQTVDPLLDTVFSSGKPLENVVITGDTPAAPGEQRHWLTAWFPVRTPDGQIPWVGAFVLDITDQKRTEKALRQAREQLSRANVDLDHTVQERTARLRETVAELEGFSYSLVHDLRAPLRAMLSYGGILQAELGPRLESDHRELLRRIGVAASRMDQLITDSLNYSRILRQELPLGPVPLGPLLRGLIETYPNLHPPEAEVRIDIGDLTVHGNEAALSQVFSNLLGNAVKFVAPGVHPRVRVWAELNHCSDGVRGPGHPCARVFVQDNGIGIPKDSQDRIFGMFQRLHRADDYPGTGIGLALVKKSLERTGGDITLKSEPGQGTCFCVELPMQQDEELTKIRQ